MTIELSEETKQKFGGRILKRGERVRARMLLSFSDKEGNSLPDEMRDCEAVVSRIENDVPSFVAINPYNDKVMEIRQVTIPFAPSNDVLKLWSWTWLWVPLYELRPGAIFTTEDGIRAVKSEYRTDGKIDCYLLASGEYAHFAINPDVHNTTLVREIEIPN